MLAWRASRGWGGLRRPRLHLQLPGCTQAGALTGTEAWRAGERARALDHAFLELDRQMALPENRPELAELAGAQEDEDSQCGSHSEDPLCASSHSMGLAVLL